MFICRPCMDGVHKHDYKDCRNTWTDSTCQCKYKASFTVSKAIKHGFKVIDGKNISRGTD